MSCVVFRNQGAIDPKSIVTFGVSSKENPSAVGFFGTGLKYAIAILLRENCKITIFSGVKRLEFGVKAQKLRADTFDMVTMNNRKLGFTTQVGKTWKMWQALRELYCNTLDEHGEAFEAEAPPEPREGETMVVVEGRGFLDAWHKRGEVFLQTQPIAKHLACDIHPGPSSNLYYRGVKVYELGQQSLFTYNILRSVDLTEDRTLKYTFEAAQAIRSALLECPSPSTVEKVVTGPEGTYEHGFSYEGVHPCDNFLSVVGRLKAGYNRDLSPSAWAACRVWLLDSLAVAQPVELSPVDAERLKKAVSFCRSLGYPVDDYPVVVTDFLGDGVLGEAFEGTIYLSQRCFMMGTKMLAGTLIEEFIHLRHKLFDETRSMQNFLFDALVSLGERITGEPL